MVGTSPASTTEGYEEQLMVGGMARALIMTVVLAEALLP
jgi:hypothetical protein